MPTFTYSDGKSLEFEKFKAQAQHRIVVGQPAKSAGRYVPNVNVYVQEPVFNFERENRRTYHTSRNAKTIPFLDSSFVGITADQLATGVPVGVYVPIKWNGYSGRFEIVFDGLENDDLILNDDIASDETKKKVYGTKKDEDEDEEVVTAEAVAK